MSHVAGHHFDPNQPRDRKGMWSKVSGYVQKKVEENMTSEEKEIERLKQLAKEGQETQKLHQVNGEYTAERKALHEKILNKFLAEGEKSTGTIQFMGGAPGNGKSTVLDTGLLGDTKGMVTVNPDAIKDELPEYKELKKIKYIGASVFAHEESSYLSKELMSRAAAKKYDMVIDTVGDGNFENISKKVDQLRRSGYTNIKADYVSLDTKTSKDIIWRRYEATGRFVPTKYALEMNREISNLVPKLAANGLFDELRVWDNNVKDKARLIMTSAKGQSNVLDKELYQRFLNKANEKKK